MTNIETLNLALEALERYAPQHGHPDDMSDAITALRTAIEQAEKNDLERLMSENERLHVENRRLIDRIEVMGVPVGVGGYLTTTTTSPAAQRQWVGLTDTQIERVYFETVKKHRGAPMPWGQVQFGKALEAKLKEMNT